MNKPTEKELELRELWLQSLEKNPERQGKYCLGSKYKDSYLACCLGECVIVHGDDVWEENRLIVADPLNIKEPTRALLYNYKKYFLRSKYGDLKTSAVIKGNEFSSLSAINDRGITWPEIAAYIRSNPDNVFTDND